MTAKHTMNPKCALFGVELTPENDSAEHLITIAIGGKKRIEGVFCVPCNSSTGSLRDAEAGRQFRFIALQLGVVRDRGTASSGTFATASGGPIRLHPDGILFFPPAKPVVAKDKGAIRIACRVCNHAEAEKMLRGFQRTYPKLDVDAGMQNIAEDTSCFLQPVVGVTAFGGPTAGRSTVKSALKLAVPAGVEPQICNLARPNLTNEGSEPCFGFYARRDLVTNRRQGKVFHCAAVEGDPANGRLIGYVESFSVYRMVVAVSDCCTGALVKAAYAKPAGDIAHRLRPAYGRPAKSRRFRSQHKVSAGTPSPMRKCR